jgi:hypothetical protein
VKQQVQRVERCGQRARVLGEAQEDPTDRSSTPAPLAARAIVLLNALVFVDFGAAFLAKPQALAQLLDIELGSASALADMRAMYGGLPLALGILFFSALRRAAWLAPGLLLVIATSAGLALGRLYSMPASGLPAPAIFVLLASEVASLVWGLLAFRALEVRAPVQALGVAS